MPEFVTLTLRWQIMTGASPLLLINSSSLSMSVSLIWIDGLHDQSWNSLPVIVSWLQNTVTVYGWNTQEVTTPLCLRILTLPTSFLESNVTDFVEFCQSDENWNILVRVWIMFVLCRRHCYSSVSNFIYIQNFSTLDHSQIPEYTEHADTGNSDEGNFLNDSNKVGAIRAKNYRK